MTDRPDVDVVGAWADRLCRELGVDPGLLTRAGTDVTDVLDLAGRAAHAVVRPAAPVTTFIAGLLVGQGLGADTAAAAPAESFARVREAVERLAGAEE